MAARLEITARWATGAELERIQREFHAHLDACQQCREHPFNLCVVGERILRKPAEAP